MWDEQYIVENRPPQVTQVFACGMPADAEDMRSHQQITGKRELGRCPKCCAEASGGTEATVFDSCGGEAVGFHRGKSVITKAGASIGDVEDS